MSIRIIALSETKLASGQLIKKTLPEYEVCTKTTKAGQSGIAIAVKLQTFKSILDVTSTSHKDILTVRVTMATCTVRIIIGYAPQESELAELREKFFTELEIEITKCRIDGELPIVIGDMNAKIDENSSSLTALTPNGKLLLEVINNHNLDVLNFNEKCKGRWTHVIRTTGASSVLDYVMTCRAITKSTKEVIVDEECIFCPFQVRRKNGKIEPHFSDHNAQIIKLQIEHNKKQTEIDKGWKLSKEGLERLNKITNNDFITEIVGDSIQGKYNRFEKEIHDVMNKCFKKVKGRKEPRLKKKFFELYKNIMSFSRKGKAQRNVGKMYIQEILKANTETTAEIRKEKVQNTLMNITINNTFSPDGFWKLCKKSRKQTMGNSSIETKDGVELYGEDLILKAYRDEFIHRLRQREICPELKNYEKRTKQLCELYLLESKKTPEPNYSRKELDRVINNLKRGKTYGRDKIPPEVFIDGGENLKQLLLNIMNQLKSADYIPLQWIQVLIATIYKNKGKKRRLINYRGIFLKQVISKIFEKLNMNRIEVNVDKIDKFQAGARPNRSTADQTFLLRAAIDHSKYLNKPLYITVYDFAQCFDSLWLDDCLLSLHKLGVQSEVLNIIKNLNETCNIVVKTPVGLTDEFEIKSIVQQGSVSGGTLCTASTGEVGNEIRKGGCQIGTSNIRSLTFVDDIAAVNTVLQDTYDSHEEVAWFSKKKRLPLNVTKCMVMCVNGKTSDVTPRLKIDGLNLSVKEVLLYLGDQFNTHGNNKDLIEERRKKGLSCLVNSMSLCSDVTMGLYTMQTLLLLYKTLFLPVVLYNAQSWSNVTKQEMSTLQTIQLKFIKRIFHAPTSTSNPLTFLETGSLPIEQEIHTKQLTFLYHILMLQKDDPVKITYQQQLKYEVAPNWGNEVKTARHQYGIEETDEEILLLSKEKWKRLVKEKVTKFTLASLNQQITKQKNADNLSQYTELKHQKYMTNFRPTQTRTLFHVRTGIIDLKAVRKYKYKDLTCRLCAEEEEDIEHVVNKCCKITRTRIIEKIYTSSNEEDMKEVAMRCEEFATKVDKHHPSQI